jgi:hypothetical protein
MIVRILFVIMRCVAAAFAFYATARHPYAFYIETRWVVFLTCCWGLFSCRRRLWPSIAPVYAVVGLVFNPLLPFHFARTTWHNLDIAAGAALLLTVAFSPPAEKRQPDAFESISRSDNKG